MSCARWGLLEPGPRAVRTLGADALVQPGGDAQGESDPFGSHFQAHGPRKPRLCLMRLGPPGLQNSAKGDSGRFPRVPPCVWP
jgi:hypothetical protein